MQSRKTQEQLLNEVMKITIYSIHTLLYLISHPPPNVPILTQFNSIITLLNNITVDQQNRRKETTTDTK